jgi:outer membrane protein OmpA-like peptidoglycan-associated protein
MNADTDGDGLTDGEEVKQSRTDPLKVDTDDDKLTDADEIRKVKTDPLNPDTDSDKVIDGEDKCPLQAGIKENGGCPVMEKPKKGQRIVLEGIYFDFNKATIKPESEPALQKALQTLVFFPDITVEIGGHTDNKGGKKYNQKLSEQRAQSVKDWLVAHGVAANRTTVKGYGMDKPIASNKTEDGRAKNRRIEYLITGAAQ